MCEESKAMVMVQTAFAQKDGAVSLAGSSFSGECVEQLYESIAAMVQPFIVGDRQGVVIATAAMYCAKCGKGNGRVAVFVFPLPVPQDMITGTEQDGVTFEQSVAMRLIDGLTRPFMSSISVVLVPQGFSDFPHRPTAEAA